MILQLFKENHAHGKVKGLCIFGTSVLAVDLNRSTSYDS